MSDSLIYRQMTAGDITKVLDLLSGTFINEPMEAMLDIQFDEFSAVIGHEIKPVIEQGLSIVTEDAQSGEIVGVTVSHDAWPLKAVEPGPVCEKYRPIAEMINPLHHEHIHEYAGEPGRLLYFFISGVNPAYQGRGIVKTQVKQILALAEDKGFVDARLISTGPASKYLYMKFGFETVAFEAFETFEYLGERPFAGLSELGGFTVLNRRF